MQKPPTVPEDVLAIDRAVANQPGKREFGQTLTEALHHKNGFQIVPEGGSKPGGSQEWQDSAHREFMDARGAKAWGVAKQAAHDIISGAAQDPTGGATHFFSSQSYNGQPETAEGPWFRRRLQSRALVPAPYQSRSTLRKKNYFFQEQPPKLGPAD